MIICSLFLNSSFEKLDTYIYYCIKIKSVVFFKDCPLVVLDKLYLYCCILTLIMGSNLDIINDADAKKLINKNVEVHRR
jgi:hypothetical protein